jgi:hypothetical protein
MEFPIFSGFYNQVLLRLPLSPTSLFLCRAPPLLCPGHVRRPCRSRTPLHTCTCCPGLCHAASRPRAGLSPPRHTARQPARTVLRRRSPSQHHSRHLLPSNVPRVTPLLCRRPPDPVLACPCVLHVAELLPERRRDRHARRRDASSCLHTITPFSGPRALPLAFLTHALALAHFLPAQFSLPRSPLLTGPPPRPRLTVSSSPHRSPSSSQSAISTPTIHRSSPSDPIPISFTRTARPQRRRAPFLHRRSASRRPIDTDPLLPNQ